MERTGRQNRQPSIHAPLSQRRRRDAGLLLVGAVALGGCYVVPGPAAYVAPGPVYVAPAPVYVHPAPAYGYYRYGWGRHGRW
jgi:hypothetical protein